jgi:hypothetical protein
MAARQAVGAEAVPVAHQNMVVMAARALAELVVQRLLGQLREVAAADQVDTTLLTIREQELMANLEYGEPYNESTRY